LKKNGGTGFASIFHTQQGGFMKNKDLLKKIAKLESMNDQLAAELQYLEQLARALGFAEGLKTLKAAALEMLENDLDKEVQTENDWDSGQ
jgi:hypothetical protein